MANPYDQFDTDDEENPYDRYDVASTRAGSKGVNIDPSVAKEVFEGAKRGVAGAFDVGPLVANAAMQAFQVPGTQGPRLPEQTVTNLAAQQGFIHPEMERTLPVMIGEYGWTGPFGAMRSAGTVLAPGAAGVGRYAVGLGKEALSAGLAAGGGYTAMQAFPDSPVAELVGAMSPAGARFAGAAATKGFVRGADPSTMRANLAMAEGMPSTVGTATQSQRVMTFEKAISSGPGGVSPFRRVGLQAARMMRGRLANMVEGEADDIVEGGNIIRKGLFGETGYVARFKNRSHQLYDQIDRYLPESSLVPARETYQFLQDANRGVPGARAMSARMFVDSDLAKDAEAFFSDSFDNGGAIPYGALKQFRTRVGDQLADPDLIGSARRKDLKQLYGMLTKDMEESARLADAQAAKAGRPSHAQQSLKMANDYYNEGTTRIEDFYKNLDSKVSGEEVWKTVLGDNPKSATRLAAIKHGLTPPEWKEVQRRVITRLGRPHPSGEFEGSTGFSPGVFLTRYQAMKNESGVLDQLFGKKGTQLRTDLDTVAKYASQLRATAQVLANPSGTAAAGLSSSAAYAGGGALANIAMGGDVGGAARLLKSIIGGVASLSGAAHLMTNQRFVNWLAEATRLPENRIPGHIAKLMAVAKDDPVLLEALPPILEQLEQGP